MSSTFAIHSTIGGLALCLGLASCRSHPVDPSFDRAAAEAEIRKIEHDWAQVAVSGDPAVTNRIFADDFLGVSPDGAQYTKAGFIADTQANPLGFTSNELNDVKLRFYGDVAVAQGDETFTKRDGARGKFVWTDVLVRRDGEWRIVAAQDAMTSASGGATSAALFTGGDASADAKRAIDATRSAYVAAWAAGDVARITQLYTDDALVMYPNQPPVVGRNAISDYFGGFFGDFPRTEFELVSAEIVVAGEWAFDRGTYRWKGFRRADGAPEEDDGKYLVVLQRSADAAWRVARDMDNSNRAAAQATRGER